MELRDSHKDMKYKKGDRIVLKKLEENDMRFNYSSKTTTITGIRIYNNLTPDYDLDIDSSSPWAWYDADIDHEATERLKFKTIILTTSGRGQSYYYHLFNEFYADLKNCTFKQVEPKQVIPNKGDQYFFVDICDENLYGIAYFNGDETDMHLVKLGLIKDTAQECVKVAKDMLKKLELEV